MYLNTEIDMCHLALVTDCVNFLVNAKQKFELTDTCRANRNYFKRKATITNCCEGCIVKKQKQQKYDHIFFDLNNVIAR